MTLDNTKTEKGSMGDGTQKHVATLTFHEAVNYGAILQAYALQKAIGDMGVQTEVLNYSCPKIAANNSMPSSLKGRVGWMLKTHTRSVRAKKFASFVSERVKVSSVVPRESLAEFCSQYTSVVVGSDQVWNHNLTGDDRTYLLDFLEPGKRKSYAASIGLDRFDPILENDYAFELRQFDKLVVREERAADYLEELLGKRPLVACDPVFLIDAKGWSDLAVASDIDEPYVLVYTFGTPARDIVLWSKRQAEKLGCKVVCLNLAALPEPGITTIRDAGPQEFLGLIMNAELVVTPSFHGCCFSIIFNRDFCWFTSTKESTAILGRKSRLVNLLKRLSLTDRAVSVESQLPRSIDYSVSNKNVESYRADSLQVLRGLL